MTSERAGTSDVEISTARAFRPAIGSTFSQPRCFPTAAVRNISLTDHLFDSCRGPARQETQQGTPRKWRTIAERQAHHVARGGAGQRAAGRSASAGSAIEMRR